ncbi:MAG: hypothetical protein ACK559_24890, partial [bacterium]
VLYCTFLFQPASAYLNSMLYFYLILYVVRPPKRKRKNTVGVFWAFFCVGECPNPSILLSTGIFSSLLLESAITLNG